MIIIANIFSLIGACFIGYSTFSKKKDKMLYLQTADCFFNSISCLLVGSFSAMSTNLICMIRNYINAKGKMSNKLSYLFAIFILIIGIAINKKGLIGLLPPIASVEYTILSARGTTAKHLNYALLINLILWFIHDCFVKLYPSMIIDCIIIFLIIINIFKKD